MKTQDIAIIGMAGRFPEAQHIGQFYLNLRNGRDSVRPLSAARIRNTTISPDEAYDIAGYLDDIEMFDYDYFHISAGEARYMDPRQRLLMEVVHETFENAGYNPDFFNGSDTALFVADSQLNYYLHAEEFSPTLITGNMNAVIAGRIARFFNLRGDAEMIDTACSSSLAALYHACNELLLGNATHALACGINLYLFPGIKTTEKTGLEIRSADGKAKAFAAAANGTVEGEAVACVLLKPLEKALADKDVIHAVIKAVAVNQDGNLSSSLTAPDSVAQSQVIIKAWEKAGIDPGTVTFIEAHGTGTKLGDPIEIDGMNLAFRAYTNARHCCAVSSVKSNIGHTDAVAGLAGLIKTVLSLQHKELFPSLHFDAPNPFIDFENSAVYVNDKLQPWSASPKALRRAGVSSFGLIGTNFHAVLEEAPAVPGIIEPDANNVCTISAASITALRHTALALAKDIEQIPASLADISYTMNAGRRQHKFRAAVIAGTKSSLATQLEAIGSTAYTPAQITPATQMFFSFSAAVEVPVALLDAYTAAHPVFMHHYKTCIQEAVDLLHSPGYRQFVFQYAFYHLLVSKGIKTRLLIGDGVGKLVISVLRKELTLKAALQEITNDPAPGKARADLQPRLRNLVDKEAAHHQTLFVEMGPAGNLTRVLEDFAGAGLPLSVVHLDVLLADSWNVFVKDFYLAGGLPAWDDFYKDATVRRCAMSTYQFDRKRCWIKEVNVAPVEDWCYRMQWLPQSLPPALRTQAAGPVVIMMDAAGLGAALVKELSGLGYECIEVHYGIAFLKQGENAYEVVPADGNTFQQLYENIAAMHNSIAGIISLSNYQQPVSVSPANVDALLQQGCYAQFHLLRAFSPYFDQLHTGVFFVTANAQSVLPAEELQMPVASMSEGLLKGVSLEYNTLNIGGLDLEFTMEDHAQHASLICEEWKAVRSPLFAAYRGATRLVPCFTKIPAAELEPENTVAILEDGIYLVTGGGSGIGLEVCRSIAAGARVHLLISGRKICPPRSEWATCAADPSHPWHEAILAFMQIEQNGSSVTYFQADVANETQMQAMFAGIQQQYRRLDGIMHAAGVFLKGGMLNTVTLSQYEQVARPKVQGTLLLESLSRPLAPRFMVLFSSINAIAVPQFNADYAMANIFEDAFASSRLQGPVRVLSINWPGWKETGMRFRNGGTDNGYLRDISNEEGLRLLYKLLPSKFANVAVVPVKEGSLESNPFFLTAGNDLPATLSEAPVAQQSVSLPVEKSTAAIVLEVFYDVLRADTIGMDDDFFDLGGHSLNGMQLLNKLNKLFHTEIDFETLLDIATPNTLAEHIDSLTGVPVLPGTAPGIAPVTIAPWYDLSYAQKRLWLFDQVEKNKMPYVMPEAYRIRATLDVPALLHAIEKVVERHESLRTIFVVKEGVPRQQILSLAASGFRAVYNDLRAYEDAAERVKLYISQNAQLPFQLSSGPLIRVSLLQLAEDEYIFLLALHHIIADAWSVDIMIDEILQLYHASLQQLPDPLPPLLIQYKDYAAWQLQQVQCGAFELHRRFWLEQLSGKLPVLQLPLDFERGALQTFDGDSVTFTLDHSLMEGLQQLGKQEDATLYVVLLSVFIAMLHRYTGQDDILIGTPAAGRKQDVLHQQIGFYINTMLIRSRVPEGLSFNALVQQLKQYVVKAMQHDEYPFDMLVEDLGITRTTNRGLLADAGFSWIRTFSGSNQEVSFDIERLQAEVVAAKYDFWLYGTEGKDGILLKLEYNTGLFKAATIQLFVTRFREMIVQVLAKPDMPLNDTVFTTAGEAPDTATSQNDHFNFEYTSLHQ